MFAIAGLGLLLAFVYLRPQEFLPVLQGIPFLYLFVLLTAVGWALDVRLRYAAARPTPLVLLGAAYFAWSLITLAIMAPAAFAPQALLSFISFFLFVAIAQGAQSVRGLRVVTTLLLALSLLLSAVALDQAYAPQGCVKQDEADPKTWAPDGRACAAREDCSDSALEPGGRYRCERLGLFGATSVEGRVRWRGIMEDPNELALVLAMALPFAFVPFQRRRTAANALLALAGLGLIGLCTIHTQSRSGQLAFLAVLGAYLIRRLGAKGAAAAAVLGAPVLLLGGRGGDGADQSTMERLECWSVALQLGRDSPIVGVGKGQFTEHHWLTAHNSFMLALGEQGLPGLFLWSSVLYLAFKSLLSLMRAEPCPGGEGTRLLAAALFSSLCALVTSALFLSLTDHNVVWVYLGLAGALIAAARRHRPEWRVRYGWADAALVLTIDLALTAAVFVYTRVRGV
jgi:hypothetical protein